MTRIVDGLVAGGLAERLPDPRDGRAVLVAATPAGEGLMRTAAGRRILAIASAIAELPAIDRRRLAASAGLLDRLAKTVRDRGQADAAGN
jgi:DNA-binding MarR family transcriptional regulator